MEMQDILKSNVQRKLAEQQSGIKLVDDQLTSSRRLDLPPSSICCQLLLEAASLLVLSWKSSRLCRHLTRSLKLTNSTTAASSLWIDAGPVIKVIVVIPHACQSFAHKGRHKQWLFMVQNNDSLQECQACYFPLKFSLWQQQHSSVDGLEWVLQRFLVFDHYCKIIKSKEGAKQWSIVGEG